MSEKNTHIGLKVLKWFLGIVVALLVLIGIARFSLTTDPVRNFVKNKVVEIANQSLHAELKIGSIDGDLWNEIILSDISITDSDTLGVIDSLYVSYDVLSILSPVFEINTVHVDRASIFAKETSPSPSSADSTLSFNLQEIVKEDTTAKEPFYFRVNALQVRSSRISLTAPSLLPDGTLKIKELNTDASLNITDEIESTLSDLSFKLEEGRLPNAIDVGLSGAFENQEVTLKDLLVNTGRSLLKAKGQVDVADSTLDVSSEFSPLSLADIDAYLENDLPSEDVQLTLGVRGAMDALTLDLQMSSPSVQSLNIKLKGAVGESAVLNQVLVEGKGLSAEAFSQNQLIASIADIKLSVDGYIPTNYEQASATFQLDVNEINYEEYAIRSLNSSGSLKEGKIEADVNVRSYYQDELIAAAVVDQVFSESPRWELPFQLKNINLANWVDSQPPSNISLVGKAEGIGFKPSNSNWDFILANVASQKDLRNADEIVKSKSPEALSSFEINNQKVDVLFVEGSLNSTQVDAKLQIAIDDSYLKANGQLTEYTSEMPSFEFYAEAQSFNISSLNGFEEIPTWINGKVEGEGKGSSLAQMRLSARAEIDSSFVNNARVDQVVADIDLENGLLLINEGKLESAIADGTFKGRKNLDDPNDVENKLDLDLEIKNPQPIASFVGLEKLQAQGNLQAVVNQNGDGDLTCKASFDLNNIAIDDLFVAKQIEGQANGVVKERYEADFDLHISNPLIYDVSLEDISFNANAVGTEDSLSGEYGLNIIGDGDGEIIQSGKYELQLAKKHIGLIIEQFDINTKQRSLNLEQPFHVDVRDLSVSTDTLMLTSDQGAYLGLSVPYADSLNQKVWLNGDSFDFGILQEIIFGQRYLDGVLFGNLSLNKTADDFSGNGELRLKDIQYSGVDADEFTLQFEAQNKRLRSNLALTWNDDTAVAGSLNVPFELGNPEDFSDAFFDQDVSGYLKVEPTSLTKFKGLLERMNINETEGILTFNGSLSGTAGAPNIEGSLDIQDPVLSGIPLDTVFADFGYNHNEENLFIDAEILAAKQKAADIEVDIPFAYDFQTLEVKLVDKNAPLSAKVTTSNFNLSVFNDFIDDRYIEDLKGTLNGEVTITGTEDNLNANGSFELSKSEMQLPQAGIKLDKIKSKLVFNNEGLIVESLDINSGKGDLKINGQIGLTGLVPTELDLTAKARQFKVANSDNYNAVIDMDANLKGSLSSPSATGNISVKNGFVVLQEFGEKSVETVKLEGEEVNTMSIYDSLAIDMVFKIERNFFVRSRKYTDIEVELQGEVDAQKNSTEDLQLFGQINGVSGYVKPLGKTFVLEEAVITFSGPSDNPELFVKSSYKPPTIEQDEGIVELFYIIEGTAQSPEFRFDSNPPMEQQDIIAYTLFGRPFYTLDGWQQALGGTGGASPSDLLVNVLLDEVEALATRELGIDVVQINNTRVGNESGTSIKTGWYLNERTFFAIVNEVGVGDPKTLFILEYILSKYWDLIITQGEDSNRTGVDVRWQFDY